MNTPPPENEKKSLTDLLAEACNAVGGVEERGRNVQQNYKYQRAADIYRAFRRELFSRGLVIMTNELALDLTQLTFSNARGETRQVNQAKLLVEYQIRGHGDCLPSQNHYGVGWDAGDKAIYKAKTGANKYFLKELGLIPDEKDQSDPEADESVDKLVEGKDRMPRPPDRGKEKPKQTAKASATPAKLAPANKQISWTEIQESQKTPPQQRTWAERFWDAARDSEYREDQVRAYIKSLGVNQTSEIPEDKREEALKWAKISQIPEYK